MTGTAIQIQVVCHLLPVERNLKTMVAVFPGLCGQIGQQSGCERFLKEVQKNSVLRASKFLRLATLQERLRCIFEYQEEVQVFFL